MGPQRCPTCGGALKEGAQWCGLCYADLRPPPAVPPPPPAPPAPLATPALFTPVAEAAAEPAAEPAVTVRGWPCVECGALNPFELEMCASCGSAFGAALREAHPPLPGNRRTRIVAAVTVVFLLLAVIALLSIPRGHVRSDAPTPAPTEVGPS